MVRVRLGFLSLLLLALSMTVSCSREVTPDLKLSIDLPNQINDKVSSKIVSAQGVLTLEHVIVNLRLSKAAPNVYKKFTYDAGKNLRLPIVIPGTEVPKSPNLYIQYVGVYSGNGMVFYYGSTSVNSDVSGLIEANITATQFGNAGVEFSRLQGRYTPASYLGSAAAPTGKVSSYFRPNALDPEILIDESDMISGWMNLISLTGIPFRHVIKFDLTNSGTQHVIFGGPVDVSSVQTGNSAISKVVIPDSFRLEEMGDGSVRIDHESAQAVYYGFFGDGTLTASAPLMKINAASAGSACFHSATQLVPNVYLDNIASSPMVYHPSDTSKAHADLAYSTFSYPTNCASGLYDFALVANPDWFKEGHDGPTGIAPPFAAVNWKADFSNSPEFLKVIPSTGSGPVSANLYWKYLGGTSGLFGAVSGATVYHKNGRSDGGGGGDNYLPCNQYAVDRGYAAVADVSYPTSNSTILGFNYDRNSSSYIYEQSFLVCPYLTISGTKKYYKNAAESHCSGGHCGDQFHLGLNVPSALTAISTDTAITDPTIGSTSGGGAVSGAASRIATNITVGTSTLETDITTAATHSFLPGDELLIRITANYPSSACGYADGNDIGTRHLFARALPGTTGSNVRISRGTWVDFVDTSSFPSQSGNFLVGPYCNLHITKVVHFGSLSLAAATSLTGINGNISPFYYGSNYGGVIAFRVSGDMTIGSGASVNASEMGYKSVAAANGNTFYGYSSGAYKATVSTNGAGGGAFATTGGDGGAYSSSGESEFLSNMYNDLIFLIGSSGGGGVSAAVGGSGGGAIFVVANKLYINTPYTSFYAKGGNGASETGIGTGGGGGGAVNIYANKVTSQASCSPSACDLIIDVSGGDGGDNAGTPLTLGGGGGGHGVISTWLCDANNALFTPDDSLTVGGTSGVSGYPAVSDGATDPAVHRYNKAKACY